MNQNLFSGLEASALAGETVGREREEGHPSPTSSHAKQEAINRTGLGNLIKLAWTGKYCIHANIATDQPRPVCLESPQK